MKLSNRQLEPQRLELSMTSMIDVVFLLLIFFLVSTTFIQPEKEIVSAIQVDDTDTSTNQSTTEPAMVDVFLSPDNKSVFQIGTIRSSDIEDISKVLAGFENKSEGAFVRVSGEVPYEAAAQAIGACRANGFNSVSYLPLE